MSEVEVGLDESGTGCTVGQPEVGRVEGTLWNANGEMNMMVRLEPLGMASGTAPNGLPPVPQASGTAPNGLPPVPQAWESSRVCGSKGPYAGYNGHNIMK